MIHRVFLSLVAAGAVASTLAEEPPKLPGLGKALEQAVAEKRASGALLSVSTPDQRYIEVRGLSDISSPREMAEDDLFWIASMTKPVCGVATMILVDEGKIDLDAAMSRYLPAFEKLVDAEGKAVEVTVRQCLNHTSGLSDLPQEVRAGLKDLQELVDETVKRPVNFEPGTQWKYCQTSINSVGRVIEVVSGVSFEQFCQTRIFGPLGMRETMFFPTRELCDTRLAKTYRVPELNEEGIGLLDGHLPWERDRYVKPNAGLFSTAADMDRFMRMILNEGFYDDHRILSPDAVAEMLHPTTDGLKTGFTPGNGWAVGFCIVRKPQGVTASLSPGSFGHGGAHGTQMWADPKAKRVDLLMVQRTGVKNGDAAPLRQRLHELGAAATKE